MRPQKIKDSEFSGCGNSFGAGLGKKVNYNAMDPDTDGGITESVCYNRGNCECTEGNIEGLLLWIFSCSLHWHQELIQFFLKYNQPEDIAQWCCSVVTHS